MIYNHKNATYKENLHDVRVTVAPKPYGAVVEFFDTLSGQEITIALMGDEQAENFITGIRAAMGNGKSDADSTLVENLHRYTGMDVERIKEKLKTMTDAEKREVARRIPKW